MASKPFQFKQFSVADDRCAHKVGTDAVLLATWVHLDSTSTRILDVGTGCGVIALIIAQRSAASTNIDAIDIAEPDAQQAAENVGRSPWRDRVVVHHKALQEFEGRRCYDLVISNPPFFADSLLSPDPARTRARHLSDLTVAALVEHSKRLLAPVGRLALILPPVEASRFETTAFDAGLKCVRRTRFRTRPARPVERILMEL